MNRCKEIEKRGLRDKKGLYEVIQIVVVIGLIAVVSAKVLPPLAGSMNDKATETEGKLSAIDDVYDEAP